MMAPTGYSLSVLRMEREELRKDYIAFSAAYDAIRRRVQECIDNDPPRNPLLHQWSGTSAVCGALELSIHAIHRTLEEYDSLIARVESGELTNTDQLALVRGEEGKEKGN